MQVWVRDVEAEATCGRCSSPWVWGPGWETGHHFFRPTAGRFAGVAGGGLQLLKITFARSGTQSAGAPLPRSRAPAQNGKPSCGGAERRLERDAVSERTREPGRCGGECAATAIRRIHQSTRLDSGARPSAASGCDVAEGAVTDYIEDPGGQAGTEGSLIDPKPTSRVVEHLADHACVHAEGASNPHSGAR
jgi:hypothetical protein